MTGGGGVRRAGGTWQSAAPIWAAPSRKATTVRAQAERLEGATAAGFTEEALAAAAGGLDASALAIARRHDPYTVAGGAQRDRQAELLTARLEQLASRHGRSDLRRASLTDTPPPPARSASATRWTPRAISNA